MAAIYDGCPVSGDLFLQLGRVGVDFYLYRAGKENSGILITFPEWFWLLWMLNGRRIRLDGSFYAAGAGTAGTATDRKLTGLKVCPSGSKIVLRRVIIFERTKPPTYICKGAEFRLSPDEIESIKKMDRRFHPMARPPPGKQKDV